MLNELHPSFADCCTVSVSVSPEVHLLSSALSIVKAMEDQSSSMFYLNPRKATVEATFDTGFHCLEGLRLAFLG